MPHYKLHYFNFRGYGEGVRLLFKYADIDFEDHRISMDQWPTIKPTMPFHQMPVLEVDGTLVAQSGAIYRYLGKQFGLSPESPVEEALVDSIFETYKDYLAEVRPYLLVVNGYATGDKEKLLKEVGHPARDKWLPFFTNFLKKSESGYLVGKKISWADIVIADMFATNETQIPEFLDSYPEVKKFVDHVNSLPKIKKWRAERPVSAY